MVQQSCRLLQHTLILFYCIWNLTLTSPYVFTLPGQTKTTSNTWPLPTFFVVIDLYFYFIFCFLNKIVFEFKQAASIDRHHAPLWQPASVLVIVVMM